MPQEKKYLVTILKTGAEHICTYYNGYYVAKNKYHKYPETSKKISVTEIEE